MTTTDRLTLRSLIPEDADWITTAISDPQVHRWLTSPPFPYTRDAAQVFIERVAGDPLICAILHRGTPCGIVSIETRGPAPAAPDLGYWLARAAWGQGIMTEAAGALVDKHFDISGSALESGWIEGNVASGRVLSKIGFVPTGETRMMHANFHGCEMPVIRVRLEAPARP